jgi:hypothetical protein
MIRANSRRLRERRYQLGSCRVEEVARKDAGKKANTGKEKNKRLSHSWLYLIAIS